MSAASDYLEGAILEYFRGTNLTASSNYYIALHTTDPTDAATDTEVTLGAWPAYVRKAVGTSGQMSSAWSTVSTEAGGGKQIANANVIDWPANDGASAVVVTHFSVWDALGRAAGNMLVSAALTNAKTIDPTDIFRADTAALKIIIR